MQSIMSVVERVVLGIFVHNVISHKVLCPKMDIVHQNMYKIIQRHPCFEFNFEHEHTSNDLQDSVFTTGPKVR